MSVVAGASPGSCSTCQRVPSPRTISPLRPTAVHSSGSVALQATASRVASTGSAFVVARSGPAGQPEPSKQSRTGAGRAATVTSAPALPTPTIRFRRGQATARNAVKRPCAWVGVSAVSGTASRGRACRAARHPAATSRRCARRRSAMPPPRRSRRRASGSGSSATVGGRAAVADAERDRAAGEAACRRRRTRSPASSSCRPRRCRRAARTPRRRARRSRPGAARRGRARPRRRRVDGRADLAGAELRLRRRGPGDRAVAAVAAGEA